ncbi:MAG: hypothetical protein Q7J38_01365 [Gallionella sp.]|nr:hypothetical protein [Gallionella sp.]
MTASGEDIFKAACAECHKKEGGKVFELSGDKASAAIAKKLLKAA